MNLQAVGKLVAERRRSRRLTLRTLAAEAGVGRSTLAALEAGTLKELGYVKVARICSAVDLVLEPRPFTLDASLVSHRHLTESAGRELTKAALEDIVLRGDIDAWRDLMRTIQGDGSGRIARRAREVISHSDRSDHRVRAFSTLLSEVRKSPKSGHTHG